MKFLLVTSVALLCSLPLWAGADIYANWGGLGHPPVKSVENPRRILPIKTNKGNIFVSPSYHEKLAKEYGHEITAGNKLSLKENAATFKHAIHMIEHAKISLWLANMFMRYDSISAPVFDALERAARRGVDVRLVLDKFFTKMNAPEYVKKLEKAGAKITFVASGLSLANEVIPGNGVANSFHSKVWIRDCQEVLVSGGNVIDSQVGADGENWGYRDTSLNAIGALATSACLDYVKLWLKHGKQDELIKKSAAIIELKAQLERKQGLRGKNALNEVNRKNGVCYYLHQGKHTDKHLLSNFLTGLVKEASSYIYLTSLHDFSGPSSSKRQQFFSEVKNAADRGAQIDIHLNGQHGAWTPYEANPSVFKPNDSWLTNMLGNIYKKKQAQAVRNADDYLQVALNHNLPIRGWRFYQFNHNKVMYVDGLWSVVGTHNLELRSFAGNAEVAAACIDEKLNQQMERMFVRDLKNSIPMLDGKKLP